MPAVAPLLVTQHWDDHLAWMDEHWQPGQHIANIGPTGEGKTTYSVGLLGIRKWVFALDPKGEDSTLSASGFVRVRSLPPVGTLKQARYRYTEDGRKWERIWRAIEAGQPARVIAGGQARSADQVRTLRKLMGDCVEFARYSRGWTVYVDEFEVAASQQMYALGPPISQMLNTAREAGTSVVTSFQAPAWVPKHATRQARFAVMYPTGDRQMIKNVAEGMGREWKQLAAAVDELPRYFALVIPRSKHEPMILVNAPRVG
jgi:hypothetical protein